MKYCYLLHFAMAPLRFPSYFPASPSIGADLKEIALAEGNKFFYTEVTDADDMLVRCIDFADELEALREPAPAG